MVAVTDLFGDLETQSSTRSVVFDGIELVSLLNERHFGLVERSILVRIDRRELEVPRAAPARDPDNATARHTDLDTIHLEPVRSFDQVVQRILHVVAPSASTETS